MKTIAVKCSSCKAAQEIGDPGRPGNTPDELWKCTPCGAMNAVTNPHGTLAYSKRSGEPVLLPAGEPVPAEVLTAAEKAADAAVAEQVANPRNTDQAAAAKIEADVKRAQESGA